MQYSGLSVIMGVADVSNTTAWNYTAKKEEEDYKKSIQMSLLLRSIMLEISQTEQAESKDNWYCVNGGGKSASFV